MNLLALNDPGTALPWADNWPWVVIIVVPGVILGIVLLITKGGEL